MRLASVAGPAHSPCRATALRIVVEDVQIDGERSVIADADVNIPNIPIRNASFLMFVRCFVEHFKY